MRAMGADRDCARLGRAVLGLLGDFPALPVECIAGLARGNASSRSVLVSTADGGEEMSGVIVDGTSVTLPHSEKEKGREYTESSEGSNTGTMNVLAADSDATAPASGPSTRDCKICCLLAATAPDLGRPVIKPEEGRLLAREPIGVEAADTVPECGARELVPADWTRDGFRPGDSA